MFQVGIVKLRFTLRCGWTAWTKRLQWLITLTSMVVWG